MADSKLDREFLRSILTLAARPAVDHLLLVTDLPLSKELRGRPLKKKIIYAVTEDQLAQNLRKQGYVCVTVPPYDYSRIEKVKVALVAAVTADALKDAEDVLCMTGRTGARLPDTVVRLQIGRGFEEKASIDTQGLRRRGPIGGSGCRSGAGSRRRRRSTRRGSAPSSRRRWWKRWSRWRWPSGTKAS